MSTNKNNGGWGIPNADKFNFDIHSRQLEKNDEQQGLSRLVDDGSVGNLRRNLLQLAATSDEAQDVLRENGIELPTVAKQFRLSHGETGTIVANAQGLWTATIVADGETRSFLSENRDSAMMLAERHLEKNRGPRELTQGELLRVMRLGQSGESANAIELYVALALNDSPQNHKDAQAILDDPSLTSLLNSAARFVWSCSRSDYIPDEEFEKLLDQVSASRALTIHSVDSIYDRYLEEKAQAIRHPRRAVQPDAPESEPVVTQGDLERLSDSEIDKLRQAALLERGRRVKQFDQEVFGR